MLSPAIRPAYAARVEHRVVVEEPDERSGNRYHHVAEVEDAAWRSPHGAMAVLNVAVAEPLVVVVPESESHRQHFVGIRDPRSGRVVTVIETLSPINKRSGPDERREYARKRRELLRSDTSLVEIHLLRGGESFEIDTDPPAGTFRVFDSRPWRRPEAELYPIDLLEPLPTIRVPLNEDDEPVTLNIQKVVDTVYERAGYETLDYGAELAPPLPEAALALITQADG